MDYVNGIAFGPGQAVENSALEPKRLSISYLRSSQDLFKIIFDYEKERTKTSKLDEEKKH